MKTFNQFLLLTCFVYLLTACQEDPKASLAIINADVYTVNDDLATTDAIAFQNDIIIALGSDEVNKLIDKSTKVIDAKGQFVMPGFIESHGHFSNMGRGLQNLNFLASKSWQEIVSQVEEKIKTTEKGTWIYGRGWHQEKWNQAPDQAFGGYPSHHSLSSISPDHPVMLVHASGHSLFANEKAMELAGVNIESPDPEGGKIIRDQTGEATGVFEENALLLVQDAYNEYIAELDQHQVDSIWYYGIELAQKECLENGITSFQDAGSKFFELERYEKMAKENKFDIRLWAMLRHSSKEMNGKAGQYRMVDVGNKHFTCRAIKSELDGALGAHGAWLHKCYHDKDGFHGQNTTTIEEVEAIAKMAFDNEMQLCVHAIGDKANHETLNIFESYANKADAALRWRVEHAQHLLPSDIPRFKPIGAIASMQAIHCTSDAPFVEKRLGSERSKNGAYNWRDLLDAGAVICNGTDAPVEDVDPRPCLYASVTRKRVDNGMEFFPEQSMTRKEALRSYTLDGAYAAFEEKDKGSLEKGKLADVIILDTNLSSCSDEELLEAKVLYTIVGGEVKYENL